MSRSPLFATAPVITTSLPKPVIIVGLPRSGSSFLSDVLSQTSDYFVFDDLYLRREAYGRGLTGPLTDEQLKVLISFLGWQIRARIQFGSFNASRTKMTLEEVGEMDRALLQTFTGQAIRWHELLEEWLGRLALHHNCSRWGFKAPQDFMHMHEYAEYFPDISYIYLHRDPRSVLTSMKFVDKQNGNRWHYHPIAYANYWRMADETIEAKMATMPRRICPVAFQDLVTDRQATAERLSRSLETTIGEVQHSGHNSSFATATTRQELTPTETHICERIAGAAMQRRGYTLSGAKWRLRDVPDLALTTTRFATSQLWRIIKTPSARNSIQNYLAHMRGRPTP